MSTRHVVVITAIGISLAGCRTIGPEKEQASMPGTSILLQTLRDSPVQAAVHRFPPLPSFPIVEREWGETFHDRHPVLTHAESADALEKAKKLLSTYTASQLKAMVPRQVAGFNWSRCPHCKTGDNAWGVRWKVQDRWGWEPKAPHTIVCKQCARVFPNDKDQVRRRTYLNPAGEEILVSYYVDEAGQEYFPEAIVDSFKDSFCRDALKHLGHAYHQAGDESFAEAAIAILTGYAEVVPHFLTYGARRWGAHKDKAGYLSTGGPYRRDGKVPDPKPDTPYGWQEGRGPTNSLWCRSLSADYYRAYDLIYKSEHFADRRSPDGTSSLRFWIENRVFDSQAEYLLAYPWKSQIDNNLAGHVGQLSELAMICGRPEYARFTRDWCQGLFYHYMNHHDMVTSEGPGYQYTWAAHISSNFNILGGYSDPPGYTDENGQRIDGFDSSRMPFRVRQTMGPSVFRFPTGRIYPIGDTAVDKSDSYRTLRRSVDRIAPGFGLTCLGDGGGEKQFQAVLNWSGGQHAHSHEDVNSFILFANGRELFSDPGKAWDSRSTFSHSTVVVDDEEAGHKVEPAGSLELFTPRLPGISITRAESAMAAYPGLCNRYRRTLVRNTVDPESAYVLDVFEVVGGEKHEYVLNGSHEKAHSQQSSASLALEPFSVPAPEDPEENRGWAGMSDMGIAPVAADGFVDFRFDDDPGLGTRTHFQRDDSLELILGRMVNFRFGPAHPYQRNLRSKMPKGHTAPKMILRHEGASGLQSCFVLVHEVLNGRNVIRGIAHQVGKRGVLSVQVDLGERRDYYAIALDKPTNLQSGPLTGKGLFAAAVTEGDACDLWMAGATEAECLGRELVATDAEYTGAVQRVVRKEHGAPRDAYLTNAKLPVGDEFRNEIVMLEFFDDHGDWQFTLSSEIEEVLADGRRRWVILRQDAGVVQTKDGTWQELFAPRRQAASCRLKVIASGTTVPTLDWTPRRERYDAFDVNALTVLDESATLTVSARVPVTVTGEGFSVPVAERVQVSLDRRTQVTLRAANPAGVMHPPPEILDVLPPLPDQMPSAARLRPGLLRQTYKGRLEYEHLGGVHALGDPAVASQLNAGNEPLPRRHSMTFEGYLSVPQSGRYHFYSRPRGRFDTDH